MNAPDIERLQHLPRFAGRAFTEVVCHPERLDQPLRWSKPRRIFVNSMSDLFHEDVQDRFIRAVFGVMALTPGHSYQILTKRPKRMRDWVTGLGDNPLVYRYEDPEFLRVANRFPDGYPNTTWPLPNVWLGVSVEDQATADERITILLDTPAAVRWISAEPLLGPIDLTSINHHCACGVHVFSALECDVSPEDDAWLGACLDWVVVGGESGPMARPMHPDWARSLRDQCAAAGVPFLFKQWGEWVPYERDAQPPFLFSQHGDLFDGHGLPDFESGDGERQHDWHFDFASQLLARRVGKRAAGRMLDGVQHDGYPGAAK